MAAQPWVSACHSGGCPPGTVVLSSFGGQRACAQIVEACNASVVSLQVSDDKNAA
jgi:hypothetical protein